MTPFRVPGASEWAASRLRSEQAWIDPDAAGFIVFGMTPPCSAEEIAAACQTLPGWLCAQDALAKTFLFRSFREALSFMVRVGFEAEALNHHPEWSNVYNRVAIRLTTHDAGNKVTARDLELARRIQKISWVG